MEKLIAKPLIKALEEMAVGSTCIAPDGYSEAGVRRACSDLNSRGYYFTTTRRTGQQLITRLK